MEVQQILHTINQTLILLNLECETLPRKSIFMSILAQVIIVPKTFYGLLLDVLETRSEFSSLIYLYPENGFFEVAFH